MTERPVGGLLALSPRHDVSEAEVDSQQNACLDDVVRDIRESRVGARLLHDGRDIAGDIECECTVAEIKLERVNAPVMLLAPDV